MCLSLDGNVLNYVENIIGDYIGEDKLGENTIIFRDMWCSSEILGKGDVLRILEVLS